MAATAKVVDMSSVKERGNFNTRRVPAGDYAAKIVNVEDAESKAGNFQYVFTIKLQKFSQTAYPYYCGVEEKQLWKLRNVMIAGGVNVPKSRVKLDPNKVVGRSVGVTMEDEEYDGKEKSVIAAIFPIAELAEGQEVPDEDADAFDEGSEEAIDPEASDDEDGPVAAVAEPETEDMTPKKAKKDKKAKKGKKSKTDEENLEELDLSEV